MHYFPKKSIGSLLAVVLLIAASLACGSETPSPTQIEQATSPPPATEDQEPEATTPPAATEPKEPEPTTPPEPTSTPIPEPTDTEPPPTPEYKEPVTLLEFDGVGETITDNYELPACDKAVFFWAAAPTDIGTASLILHLHKVGEDRAPTIVNEFDMDVPEGISGATLQPLNGGEYYFASENTDQSWSIRVECQDGQAPAGEGIDLEGTGNVVTDNYALPAGDKSVFSWSADPNSLGAASLIVHLCKVDSQCVTLVNEFEMDLEEPLTGEALQGLKGGLYFLATENTSGPWAVRWECRD